GRIAPCPPLPVSARNIPACEAATRGCSENVHRRLYRSVLPSFDSNCHRMPSRDSETALHTAAEDVPAYVSSRCIPVSNRDMGQTLRYRAPLPWRPSPLGGSSCSSSTSFCALAVKAFSRFPRFFPCPELSS